MRLINESTGLAYKGPMNVRCLLMLCPVVVVGCFARDDLDVDPVVDEVEVDTVDVRRVWREMLFDDGSTEVSETVILDDGSVSERVRLRHEQHGFDVFDDAFLDDLERQWQQDFGDDDDDSAFDLHAPGKCKDGAYSLMGHRWSGTYNWKFNAGSRPSGSKVNDVEHALRAAANNITRSDNTCGFADLVSAKASYKGRTTLRAQITKHGACGQADGNNVVAFGDLPGGVLGVACVFSQLDGRAVEADIVLNKHDFKFTTKPGAASCTNKYDIQAVATHEFGHVFGLGHVAEATHGKLVMSTAINGPCQASERNLGRGDVRALRQLY